MKRAVQMLLLTALLITDVVAGQVSRSRFDPASASHSAQQKSFVDWTLSQINSKDVDYGKRIEEMRQTILADTFRDSSFRTDALLIAALCVLYVCYWWECRTKQALRISATRIVTAYHSELAMAREEIARLWAEYTQAKRILDEQLEAEVVARPEKTKSENGVSSGNGARGTIIPGGNGKTVEPQLSDQDNGLKQQLVQANDTITSLRRQVSVVTRKYEEEQQKNRKLRGE